MAFGAFDFIHETTLGVGTGDLVLLGAVNNCQPFSSRYADGDTFYYAIQGQIGGQFECGYGHFIAASNSISRDVVEESSNSDTLVNFSAGTKDVSVTATAAQTLLQHNAFSSINCTFNGAGSALSAGLQAVVRVPYSGVIVEATLMADRSGSCVVDVWNAGFGSYPPVIGNSICASDLPTLSSAESDTDTTLTGWTTTFVAGSVFLFNLTSSSTIHNLVVALKIQRDN